MKRQNVCRNLNKLVNMKIIIKIQDDNGSVYEFNKDYDQWEVVAKQRRRQTDNEVVAKQITPPVAKQRHTKYTITKDNIQKKSNASVVFPKTLKSYRDQRRVEAGKPPMAPRPMTSDQKRASAELFRIQPLIDRYKELASEKGLSYMDFPEEMNQKLRRQFLNVISKYGDDWDGFLTWLFTTENPWPRKVQWNPESCVAGFMMDAYRNKDVVIEDNQNKLYKL